MITSIIYVTYPLSTEPYEITNPLVITAGNGESETYDLAGVVLQHRNPAHVTCVIRAKNGCFYHFDDSSRSRPLDKGFMLEVIFDQ